MVVAKKVFEKGMIWAHQVVGKLSPRVAGDTCLSHCRRSCLPVLDLSEYRLPRGHGGTQASSL